MRFALTDTEKNLLLQRPHRTKLYMVVDKPTPVFTAQVNNPSIGSGARSIAYNNGAGDTASVKSSMTLLVGTTAGARDLGIVRVKSISGTTTGTITVAENSDVAWAHGAYLSILPEFRLWSVYPRITYVNKVVDWFKDYDINYNTNIYRKQNVWLPPVAIMGPPAVAFLDGGSATVKFVGEYSYTLCPNGIKINKVSQGDVDVSSACTWSFQSGSPSSKTTLGTKSSPHEITWTTAGRYLASLTVKNNKPSGYEKTTTTYRPVFILNRPGTAGGVNEPYEKFELVSCQCDFDSGGWEATIRVFGDADIYEFPDGAMVVIFAEEWYGSTKQSIGGYPYRENIKLVGWIVSESIRQEWTPEGERYVEFRITTVDGLMKEKEAFPTTIEDRPSLATGNTEANEWYQMFKLQVNRAALYLLYWHTTLLLMTDVSIVNDNSRIAAQDFPAASLYRQIDDYTAGAVLGRCLSDRQSCVFIEKNIQTEPGSWRTRRPIVLALDKNTHLDEELEMARAHLRKTRLLELSGVGWSGSAASAIFAKAPGGTPAQDGVDEVVKGLVFDYKDKSQAEANEIAGRVFAYKNNPWPDIPLKFQGNHSYLDIAPQGWLTLSLGAQDTKRGVVWNNKKLVPRQVTWNYDPELQLLQVDTNVEADAEGTAGVTGDYELPGGGPPPTTPESPWPLNSIGYLGTRQGLYWRRPRTAEWSLATPLSTPFSETDDLMVNHIELCSNSLVNGVCPVLVATDQGLFRGDIARTDWSISWTRFDIPDPPNTWSLDPAPAEEDLIYEDVRVDITDTTGNKFWFVARLSLQTRYDAVWLGKTTDGGVTFTWYPITYCWNTGTSPWITVKNLDVDKVAGDRIFVALDEFDEVFGLIGYLFIFDNVGNKLKTIRSTLMPPLTTPFDGTWKVWCPYKPAGSSVTHNWFALYGVLSYETGGTPAEIGNLIYTTDLGETFYSMVNPPLDPLDTEFLPFMFGVLPSDEKDTVFVFSNSSGELFFERQRAKKWYDGWTASEDLSVNLCDLGIPSGVSFIGCRHARVGSAFMFATHIYDDNGVPNDFVYLSSNGGVSWIDVTENLAGGSRYVICCELDGISVL